MCLARTAGGRASHRERLLAECVSSTFGCSKTAPVFTSSLVCHTMIVSCCVSVLFRLVPCHSARAPAGGVEFAISFLSSSPPSEMKQRGATGCSGGCVTQPLQLIVSSGNMQRAHEENYVAGQCCVLQRPPLESRAMALLCVWWAWTCGGAVMDDTALNACLRQ